VSRQLEYLSQSAYWPKGSRLRHAFRLQLHGPTGAAEHTPERQIVDRQFARPGLRAIVAVNATAHLGRSGYRRLVDPCRKLSYPLPRHGNVSVGEAVTHRKHTMFDLSARCAQEVREPRGVLRSHNLILRA